MPALHSEPDQAKPSRVSGITSVCDGKRPSILELDGKRALPRKRPKARGDFVVRMTHAAWSARPALLMQLNPETQYSGFRRTALLAAGSEDHRSGKTEHQTDVVWVSDFQT